MFKKVSIGVLVVMVAALGIVGIVAAQEPTPPTDDSIPFGPQGGERFGMHNPRGRGGHPIQALADALGLTVEEVGIALGESVVELA